MPPFTTRLPPRALAPTSDHLTAAGIPFTPAVAGMFVWLDLGAAAFGNHSTAATWEDEAALWQRLMEGHRVVLTPGGACHAAEPGFFRMCFAWPHPDSLPVAVARIAAALAEHRSSRTTGQLLAQR
jgi:1-aminocyclopropane-1-carboxylate synthase